ncbi:hypothetical protein MES5069_830023 [Mesorhizobium escarrei]|uniref:Uncharacterized protein n=1 Tax=Mesorhizobium escarrei TaxID=666018 RepID=A0ABN8KGJ7_9HYPH|nr:hypothetical protein MES5069_830023 [Mesorhizobium escarrei]
MTTSRTITIGDGTVQTRRLSWKEFYTLRPDLKPDNDNVSGGAVNAPPGVSLSPICQMPQRTR